MKKLCILALSLLMLLMPVACDSGDADTSDGGDTTPKNETPATTPSGNVQVPEIDLGSILTGNGATDYIWGKQDEATKQAIIAEGKKDGVDISFGADGSMTVVDSATGDIIIQNPDGTWQVKDAEGNVGQLGNGWPDNDFTKLLPRPSFAVLAANTSDIDFTVAFGEATVEQIRTYVEEVKAKGFTVDAEVADEENMGMTIYSFTAKNADGYMVNIFYAVGTSGLTMEKP